MVVLYVACAGRPEMTDVSQASSNMGTSQSNQWKKAGAGSEQLMLHAQPNWCSRS